MMMIPDKFMVFDVESIGLHGEGFAVGWVVVDRSGNRLGEGCMSCDPSSCKGTDESRLWVAENVPALEVTSPTKQHLRNAFWHEWRHKGAVLVADCAWPVEANFLSACVNLNHAEREWQGPIPATRPGQRVAVARRRPAGCDLSYARRTAGASPSDGR